jgi:hypothetical protein
VDGIQTAGQTILLQGALTGLLEQHWRVSGDSSDTGPGSYNLKPKTKPSTSSEVSNFPFVTTDPDLRKLDQRAWLAVYCNDTDFKVLLLAGFRFAATYLDEDISGSLEVVNGSIVAR